jgi:pimeloyl-ACP methyl ester carboxylesterase
MKVNRRLALMAGWSMLARAATGAAQAPRLAEGRIRLATGRRLGYAEYGDPAGQLVLYFHGTPGSRIEAGLLADEISAAGVRLVALERPGLGLSDYRPGRRILDWPAQAAHVADALVAPGATFGVIGLSGGAPYALACLKCIPHRLTHVAIVSGHTPPGACVEAGGADRLIETISRRPRLGRIGLNAADRRLSRNPEKFADRTMESWAAADRQLVNCNPYYRQTMIRTLQEATRCGTAGIQTDVTLLGSPWGFRLCDLPPASVSIWHGGCDTIAPLSMGRYFHRNVAGSELVVDPRAAHVTMMKWHAAAILSRFAPPVTPALATG